MVFKDKIVIGIVIGLLADVVKLAVNYISFLLNFTNVVFWQLIATRFLEKKDLFKPEAYLIGGIADITVTSVLGIIFIYAINYVGRENIWIKGIGFGLVVWAGLFGTLLGQSVQEKLPQGTSGILVTIVAHLFYGLSLTVFTRLFYDVNPALKPIPNQTQKSYSIKRVIVFSGKAGFWKRLRKRISRK